MTALLIERDGMLYLLKITYLFLAFTISVCFCFNKVI